MPLNEGLKEWNKHLGKTERGVFLDGDEEVNSHGCVQGVRWIWGGNILK
jgi:hypothetical protein